MSKNRFCNVIHEKMLEGDVLANQANDVQFSKIIYKYTEETYHQIC